MDYYQIRFTRLSDGWQTLKDFTNTPVPAIKSFSTFQNRNINPPIDEPVESMELLNDGRYVFNTRIWSNTGTDQSGRRIMYAYGYGMNLDSFIRDPGGLLSIGEDAFNNDANSIIKPIQIAKGTMNLSDTLDSLTIDRIKYKELYLSVYEILCGRMGRTLCVLRNNGWDWEDMKRCVFAIFCALPYGLRKRFTFGTNQFPNGAKYTVLFTENDAFADANELRHYFDMESGVSDLSDEKRNGLEKYGFVNAVASYGFDTDKTDGYFAELENKLIILRDETTASLDKYSLAADMVRYDKGEIPDDELSMLLERLQDIQYPSDKLKELMGELEDKVGTNQIQLLPEEFASEQDKQNISVIDESSVEISEGQSEGFSDTQSTDTLRSMEVDVIENPISDQTVCFSGKNTEERRETESADDDSYRKYIIKVLEKEIRLPIFELRLPSFIKKMISVLRKKES